ncbi:MAG: cytochrome c [Actinobacteria bacterium]|nr:cytochrome c [Actinomycetota bacterium]
MRLDKVKFQKSTGTLVFLLLIALAAFMLAGCSDGGGAEKKEGAVTESEGEAQTEGEAVELEPEEVKDPELLYVNNCGACHGHDGNGVVGPAIRGTSKSGEEVEKIINDGKGSMPKFKDGELTEEQIKIIANHVKTEFK